MKKLLSMVAVGLALVGCGQAQKASTETTESEPKMLVLYYSQTGVTAQVAQEIAQDLGIEAVSFDVTPPYDGTYEETIERCRQEMESDSLSALEPLTVDVSDYDIIFLGYPIWFGTYARPVMSLLEDTDFEGKTIIPFCTFGSGGLESSVSELRAACPEAEVYDGFGIRAARIDKAPAEVRMFLTNYDFLEGEKQQPVEFSEQHEVSEAEQAIFDSALGDSPMPLGVPASVRTRDRDGGKDYLFEVNGKTPQGDDLKAWLHVTCDEGGEPELLKVVRQ